jgi:hypothetical protein
MTENKLKFTVYGGASTFARNRAFTIKCITPLEYAGQQINTLHDVYIGELYITTIGLYSGMSWGSQPIYLENLSIEQVETLVNILIAD